ncbi:MAG: hypothetical protein Q9192_009036, partial [Flavoplaca navasiana]
PKASADQEPTKTTKSPSTSSSRVNPPKTTLEPEDEEPEEEEPEEEETEEEEPKEPEDPPQKPKPSEAIIIYRSEFCTEFSCTASARVFEVTPGEPVNPCSDRADYTESQGSIDSEDVDVGPFSAWGYEALSYHGTLSKLGVLDGLGEFELEDGTTASVMYAPCIVPAAETADCFGGEEEPIVYCEW